MQEYDRYIELVNVCFNVVYRNFQFKGKQQEKNTNTKNKTTNIKKYPNNNANKKNIVINLSTGNLNIFVDNYDGLYINGVKQKIGNELTLSYKFNATNAKFHIPYFLINKLMVFAHVSNINIHNKYGVLKNLEVECRIGNINLYG